MKWKYEINGGEKMRKPVHLIERMDHKKNNSCVKKTPRYAGEFKKGYAYEWTKKLPLIKIELLSDNNKIKSKGGH